MQEQQSISVLLYKHWKLIAFTLILAVATGVTVTFFIPKKYTSFAEVYATSSNALDDMVAKPDFGYEIHADQLIQVFQSQRIKDSVINKFNLPSYYELDTSDAGWEYELYKSYDEDIQFQRNAKLAIVITATTRDPQLSADIVNYVIDIIDGVRTDILKQNTQSAIVHYQSKYDRQKHVTDSLLNRVYLITPHATDESDPLQAYWQADLEKRLEGGASTPADDRIRLLASARLTQSDAETINDYLYEFGQLNHFKQKLRDAKDQGEAPLPRVNVLSRGKAVDKSVYPSMLTNILLSVGIGFLLVVAIILGLAKITQIRSQLK